MKLALLLCLCLGAGALAQTVESGQTGNTKASHAKKRRTKKSTGKAANAPPPAPDTPYHSTDPVTSPSTPTPSMDKKPKNAP